MSLHLVMLQELSYYICLTLDDLVTVHSLTACIFPLIICILKGEKMGYC
jgi:hypothetical protein